MVKVEDLKAGNMGATWSKLKREGGNPGWAHLGKAKLWLEGQKKWGHVWLTLGGESGKPTAVVQRAIDSDAGKVQVVQIDCGNEQHKTMTYGPLGGVIGAKRVDILWVEIGEVPRTETGEVAGNQMLELVVGYYKSRSGEMAMILSGQAQDVHDVSEKIRIGMAAPPPVRETLHCFARTDPPFPPPEATRREQVFLFEVFSPKPLRPHRLHVCFESALRLSAVSYIVELLDVANAGGVFNHLVYVPMVKRSWESAVDRVAHVMAFLPKWQASYVITSRGKVPDTGVRTRVQSKVSELQSDVATHEREVTLLGRGEQVTQASLTPQKTKEQLKEEVE